MFTDFTENLRLESESNSDFRALDLEILKLKRTNEGNWRERKGVEQWIYMGKRNLTMVRKELAVVRLSNANRMGSLGTWGL